MPNDRSETNWRRAAWLAVSLAVFGGGWVASFLQNGDAVELRTLVKQKENRIAELEKERELLSARFRPKCLRPDELERCEKLLETLGLSRKEHWAGPKAPR